MMRSWKWAFALPAVALVLCIALPAFADHAAMGTLKSATANQLVVTDNQNKDWTYRLADKAFIACPDAKDAKIADIKPGARLSVLWDKKGDEYEATAVLHHEGAFRDAGLGLGTIKKVADTQLVISDEKGKEATFTMGDGARVRLKNEDAKIDSFKAGDRVVFVYNKKGDRYNVLCLSDCAK
jgi:Cu/Ag efflux protein CusF